MSRALVSLVFALVLLVPALASAHKPSDSYLMLEKTANGLHGRWDIALRDLEPAVGLDADHDGMVNWGELKARLPVVTAYARARLNASNAAGACRLSAKPQGIVAHSDGKYLALAIDFSCPGHAASVALVYDLLFEIDAQHRGVLRYTDGGQVQPFVFGKARRTVELSRVTPRFAAIVRLGIEHILSGYDHLLFLAALLLPAVLSRRAGAWQPAANFRTVLLDVLRTVTAFTIAHSLTLALSAAHWVVLPSRFVESAIAASIVLAALNNLFPVLDADRSLAFGLGLLHGFGFAAVLADVGLSGQSFLRTLFGFNLGVEIGQLAVVIALLPLLHLLRRSRQYPTWGLPIASTAVMLVACVWLAERAFDLKIIS
ncbi:MAG: HupE/UreJ family protein [Pseudomonadota bacterium]